MFKKNHPDGVYVIFFLYTCMMASAGVIQALLVLYLTTKFLMPDGAAYSLYAAYSCSTYLTSLIGGTVGQHYLKPHIGIIVGLVLCTAGSICIIPLQKTSLMLGISCFAFGIGFISPNIYNLLGKLYQHDNIGRSSGFTIAYTGMNLGALIGFISAGYLQKYFSYQTAFFFATIFIILGLILFIVRYKDFPSTSASSSNLTLKELTIGLSMITLGIALLFFLLHFTYVFRWAVIAVGAITLATLIFYSISQKTKNPKISKNLLLISVLSLFAIIFWAIYFLQPTALIIFLDRNVARSFYGITIPTSSIMSLGALFILFLGPILSRFWLYRDNKKRPITELTKFSLALLFMSFSMIALTTGITLANSYGLTSLSWISLSFFLISTAEIIIAPAGYSAIGKLLPENLHGFMLGVWELMLGVAGALAGQIAQFSISHNVVEALPISTNHVYLKFFTLLGSIALFFGTISSFLAKKSKFSILHD